MPASARLLELASLGALWAVLLWAPLASGAYRGWPLAIAELLTLGGVLCWVLAMACDGTLEWRRTALDLPLALAVGLVLVQLAVGNRPLVAWALAPPSPGDHAAALPAVLWVGTVSPAQTGRSLRLFLTYAGVYWLAVNVVRTRVRLDRLVKGLVLLGGVLAFVAVVERLTGDAWLLAWRDRVPGNRLAGTFVNPDHFAAWLEMLIGLGVGYVLARSTGVDDEVSIGAMVRSRAGRERLIRRYLPVLAVLAMAIALVLTQSRGGIVSMVVALGALLAVQGVRGHARRSLVLVGALLAVTIAYGAWIGLGPVVGRFRGDAYAARWTQLVSTLPMLARFPLLGVGLGAYRDIYFHYQPPELLPGRVYYPFAHDDLLQLAIELGPAGAALCALAAWRVIRDLVGAHLLGRGACPVGGGRGEGARRHDRWSTGVGLGAVAAALALFAHSAFDFAARIPANGVLAAACLGIATTALHTRFGRRERLLTGVRALALGRSRLGPMLVACAALAVSAAAVVWIASAALVEARILVDRPTAHDLDTAVWLSPRDPDARLARARLRVAAARRVWDSGVMAGGGTLGTWPDRRREATRLFAAAITDLGVALTMRPSDPYLHEALGQAHGDLAAIDDRDAAAHVAAAVTALRRAIALQPGNPHLYGSLARVALGQREPRVDVALDAARDAVARDPALLPDLVERFLPIGIGEAEWDRLAPDSAIDRMELAALLDRAGLVGAAERQYRRAAALPAASTATVARWALARLLLRQGDAVAALGELDLALRDAPDDPELHLTRAMALDARRDASALDESRAALAAAEARAARPGASVLDVTGARAAALVEQVMGPREPGVARYRRPLADLLDARHLWAQAAQEWNTLLATSPLDAGARFGLARALAGLGRPTEALEQYRRAVALDPHAVRFRMALGQALWDSQQYYQAMNEWRAVIAQEPGHVAARLALARALVRTGDRAAAAREFRRVLELDPRDAEARRGLALAGEPAP